MHITINKNYIVDIKETRKLLNKRGFSFRVFSKDPYLFGVRLMPKAQDMYPDSMTAMMNIVFVVQHKKSKKNEQINIIKGYF